jgi:hypothetical protein
MNPLLQAIKKAPAIYELLGQALFAVGGFLVVAGLIGRVAMTGVTTMGARANLTAPHTLGELYKTLPTWWIPEGFFGYAVAACIAGAGAYVALKAKAAIAKHGSMRRRP